MILDWKKKEVLIIGGTGTLGQALTKILYSKYKPKGIRIFSRTEKLQWDMKNKYPNYKNMVYILGDIKDKNALDRAMNRVDIVFHTAAMKHVPACEDNPLEALRVNTEGSINVINAAIDNKIELVMYTNTDKAVKPINLYGYSKGISEKVFIKSNIYSGFRTKLSVCRYGNVLGSRGSIIELFEKQYNKNQEITITNKNMRRFWINIDFIANFIIKQSMCTIGGEIFIPKMKSLEVINLAKYLYPKAKLKYIGIRDSEKLDEDLIGKEESHRTIIHNNYYIINNNYWNKKEFEVTSKTVDRLTKKELLSLLGKIS